MGYFLLFALWLPLSSAFPEPGKMPAAQKNNEVSGTLRQEPSHLHSLTFPGLTSHATVSAYSS